MRIKIADLVMMTGSEYSLCVLKYTYGLAVVHIYTELYSDVHLDLCAVNTVNMAIDVSTKTQQKPSPILPYGHVCLFP